MFGSVFVAWLLVALRTAVAQDSTYHFTSGVSNPAPVPGQPFTLTWAGGSPDGTVFIILNYLFPFDPKIDSPYITTDILSNAPNNGSWTYNVPINIQAGRYTFSIGINPFLKTDTTPTFTILASQTGELPPGSPVSTTTNTASTRSYNGCGLIPLPDYTFTGYQAPCLITTDGHVETIFPIVPPDLSSSFYGPDALKTIDYFASVITTPNFSSSPTSPVTTSDENSNALLATDIDSGAYAQVLQCSTSVRVLTAQIVAQETTTLFASVECASTNSQDGTDDPNGSVGICHSSGYKTFSVSGTRSVCCPTGWNTTPFASSSFYCYTSAGLNIKRDLLGRRQATTNTATPTADTIHFTAISGLAFTRAGLVLNQPTTASAGGSSASAANSDTSKNSASNLSPRNLFIQAAMPLIGTLYLSFQ